MIDRLISWAEARDPDMVLEDENNEESIYLYRYFVLPRNRFFNIYLHCWVASDYYEALHDHRSTNLSFVIRGRVFEQTYKHGEIVTTEHAAGSFIMRWRGSQAHRVEMMPDETAWTLFFIGPHYREWGHWCKQGWVKWVYDPNNSKPKSGC